MTQNQQLNSIVNQLVGATDPEEVKRLYKEWAASYDADLDSFGYVAPRIGVQLLSQVVVNAQALIHDAGCGTGLVGTLLTQLGYSNLHGSDFSSEMLKQAESTNHYHSLQTLDFGGPIDVAADAYDAVISIGVYTQRFNQHFIGEMVRILRPGGHFVFSCREQYYDEVVGTVFELLKSKFIARVSVHHDDYMTGQGAFAFYFDIQKK